jgi:hypothetical protein
LALTTIRVPRCRDCTLLSAPDGSTQNRSSRASGRPLECSVAFAQRCDRIARRNQAEIGHFLHKSHLGHIQVTEAASGDPMVLARYGENCSLRPLSDTDSVPRSECFWTESAAAPPSAPQNRVRLGQPGRLRTIVPTPAIYIYPTKYIYPTGGSHRSSGRSTHRMTASAQTPQPLSSYHDPEINKRHTR